MRSLTRYRAALLAFVLAFAVSLLSCPAGFFRRGNFFFEVAVASSEPGVVQLFYDIGRGFNERDSVSLLVPAAVKPRLCRFSLPPAVYRDLRFDPINREAVVTLAEARIVDRHGTIVRDFPPARFLPLHQIASVAPIADGIEMRTTPGANDPFFRIQLDQPFSLEIGAGAWARAATVALLVAGLAALLAFAFAAGWVSVAHVRRALPWLVFSLVAAVTLFRVVTTPAPIYASDEYVCLKNSLDYGTVPLEVQTERDPGHGLVGNFLYLSVVREAARLFGDPVPALRTANFLLYFGLTAGLGCFVLRRFSAEGAERWFLPLVALAPASVYVLSPLPEVFLVAGFTFVALLTLLVYQRAPALAAAVGGIGVAFLLYLKPHAVASAAGFGLLFLAGFLLDHDRPWRMRLLVPASFAACLAGGVFAANLIFLGEATLAPRFVGPGYYRHVSAAVHLPAILSAAVTVLRYVVVHCLIILVVFPLSCLVVFAACARRIRRDPPTADSSLDHLALIVVAVGGSLVVMVSQFTFAASSLDPSEANRLHGRYLFVLFPCLLLLGCHAIARIRRHPEDAFSRLVCSRWILISHAACAVGLFFVLAGMKVLPWDYPEIFGLSPLAWAVPRWFVIAGVACLFLAGLLFPRRAHVTLGLTQVFFFAVSLFCVASWQEAHARGQAPLSAAGRALRDLTDWDARDLLLVGSDRGELSYVLCGLIANPRVKSPSAGDSISPGDIPPGTRVVAVLGPHPARFPYQTVEQLGPLTVYGLEPSAVRQSIRTAPTWDGNAFTAFLSSPRCNVRLIGFGPPEEWGVSTTSDVAELVLPVRIGGRVRVGLRAWWKVGKGLPVQVALGGATRSFSPGTTPEEFVFVLDVACPTDRVTVSFPAEKLPTGGHPPELALANIVVSAAD